MGAYLENIVYNELISRGYDVKIGVHEKSVIDFIAIKDGKKEYYQVCYTLSGKDVINMEFGAYKDLEDNYPKYVLSKDTLDMSQEGIIHKNIVIYHILLYNIH